MSDVAAAAREELLKLHPADLADRLQRLSLEEAQRILPELPPTLAAGALAELEHDRQRELLLALPVRKLTPLPGELSPKVVAAAGPAGGGGDLARRTTHPRPGPAVPRAAHGRRHHERPLHRIAR